MRIAGVDEAGYGPLLGPLVVSAAVWDCHAPATSTPLEYVTRESCPELGPAGGIDDCKKVYKSGSGLGKLEALALGVLSTVGEMPRTWRELLKQVQLPYISDLDDAPWYRGENPALPVAATARHFESVRRKTLLDLQTAGWEFKGVHTIALEPRRLNEWFRRTDNKSLALFEASTRVMEAAWDTAGADIMFSDKQGGRREYAALLRDFFPATQVRVLKESAIHSAYALQKNARSLYAAYVQEADGLFLPVAFASIISKYIRELHMRIFNEYWARPMPALKPTAGYYTDGLRFLKNIQQHPLRGGIPDAWLVRER